MVPYKDTNSILGGPSYWAKSLFSNTIIILEVKITTWAARETNFKAVSPETQVSIEPFLSLEQMNKSALPDTGG